MMESALILKISSIDDIFQVLTDLDVEYGINFNMFEINDKMQHNGIKLSDMNTEQSKVWLSHFNKTVINYRFLLKKSSFNKLNTIIVYNEIHIIVKKLKSIGCIVDLGENSESIIIAVIPIENNC